MNITGVHIQKYDRFKEKVLERHINEKTYSIKF